MILILSIFICLVIPIIIISFTKFGYIFLDKPKNIALHKILLKLKYLFIDILTVCLSCSGLPQTTLNYFIFSFNILLNNHLIFFFNKFEKTNPHIYIRGFRLPMIGFNEPTVNGPNVTHIKHSNFKEFRDFLRSIKTDLDLESYTSLILFFLPSFVLYINNNPINMVLSKLLYIFRSVFSFIKNVIIINIYISPWKIAVIYYLTTIKLRYYIAKDYCKKFNSSGAYRIDDKINIIKTFNYIKYKFITLTKRIWIIVIFFNIVIPYLIYHYEDIVEFYKSVFNLLNSDIGYWIPLILGVIHLLSICLIIACLIILYMLIVTNTLRFIRRRKKSLKKVSKEIIINIIIISIIYSMTYYLFLGMFNIEITLPIYLSIFMKNGVNLGILTLISRENIFNGSAYGLWTNTNPSTSFGSSTPGGMNLPEGGSSSSGGTPGGGGWDSPIGYPSSPTEDSTFWGERRVPSWFANSGIRSNSPGVGTGLQEGVSNSLITGPNSLIRRPITPGIDPKLLQLSNSSPNMHSLAQPLSPGNLPGYPMDSMFTITNQLELGLIKRTPLLPEGPGSVKDKFNRLAAGVYPITGGTVNIQINSGTKKPKFEGISLNMPSQDTHIMLDGYDKNNVTINHRLACVLFELREAGASTFHKPWISNYTDSDKRYNDVFNWYLRTLNANLTHEATDDLKRITNPLINALHSTEKIDIRNRMSMR